MVRGRLALASASAMLCLVAAFAAGASGNAAFSAGGAGAPDVTSNWAGYAAIGPGSSSTTASSSMAFTDVTGQWREPKAICNGTPTSVAIWVGLGGYSVTANALEQTGTSADCHANGTATYYAWYELVPADSVTVGLKVMPGDVITSSVVINGTDVLVQVIDRTRKTRFTKHLTMAAPDLTSAEWVAEAPAECGGFGECRQIPLTNFGTVNFTRSFAKGNDVSGTISNPSWISNPLQLIPHSSALFGRRGGTATDSSDAGASTSSLNPAGTGFTMVWQAHPVAPAQSVVPGGM